LRHGAKRPRPTPVISRRISRSRRRCSPPAIRRRSRCRRCGAADCPESERASIIAALARVLHGDVDGTGAAILSRLEREPEWLDVPALSGALAVVLDRFPEIAGRDALLAALGRTGGRLAHANPLLIALVVEAAVRAGSDADTLASLSAVARDRPYRREEYDALRRVASAIAKVDPAQAAELGARYAALCAEAFAPAVPLGWPIRSAGWRLRPCRVGVGGCNGRGDAPYAREDRGAPSRRVRHRGRDDRSGLG
jgi:hypothetical protein